MNTQLTVAREEGYQAYLANPSSANPYPSPQDTPWRKQDYTSLHQAWQWGFDLAEQANEEQVNGGPLLILGAMLAICFGLAFLGTIVLG